MRTDPAATPGTSPGVAEGCHYRNLPPLWAADNLAKSDRKPT